MNTHSIPIIEKFPDEDSYIESLINVVSEPFFQSLVGSVQILNFLINDSYDDRFPEDWKQFFDRISTEEFLQLLLGKSIESRDVRAGAPASLLDYVDKIRDHQLLRRFKSQDGSETTTKLELVRSVIQGMSAKKVHEVEHFTPYLTQLLNNLEDDGREKFTHLIDFGAGLCYLSRSLAAPPYNRHVVAIESDPSRIEAGKALDARLNLNSTRTTQNIGSMQYFEKKIEDGDVKSIVSAISGGPKDGNCEFGKELEDVSLMIISLHSCGNLTHHAINAFLHTPEVKALAVVGCCYNLMTEKLEPKISHSMQYRETCANDDKGFPLSSFLTSKGVSFNISARMLACQAPDNWTLESSTNFFTRHFYRALLQRVFYEKGIISPDSSDVITIGSLRKRSYDSFYQYVNAAVEKIMKEGSSLDEKIKSKILESDIINFTIPEAEDFEQRFKHRKKHLSFMWSMLAFCAGCVESMIVVDRWLYLGEHSQVKTARIEIGFDYSVSPRNLVLVASK